MKLKEGYYCTNYEANGELFLDKACFADFFNHRPITEVGNYKVFIIKDSAFGIRHNINHCLLFDIEGMNEHMLQLKAIIPTLEYEITSAKIEILKDADLIDCYVISFTLCDKDALVHKYALTWVRYLYEFPYNIILKEVYKLKDYNIVFKRQSVSNLYMLCSSAFPTIPGMGHSVHYSGYFIPKKTIIHRLHTVAQLNNIYHCVGWNVSGDNNLRLNVSSDKYMTTEYWDDPEEFLKRIPHYLRVMNFLKHNKDA